MFLLLSCNEYVHTGTDMRACSPIRMLALHRVILRGFIDSKVKLLESQQSGRSGIAGTTLKGQTYLNMQLTEPEPAVDAAFGSLRLSTDEVDSAASTPTGPPPLFTPSALLLRVCPELRTWTVPEVCDVMGIVLLIG